MSELIRCPPVFRLVRSINTIQRQSSDSRRHSPTSIGAVVATASGEKLLVYGRRPLRTWTRRIRYQAEAGTRLNDPGGMQG